jgi:hypothetical protein
MLPSILTQYRFYVQEQYKTQLHYFVYYCEVE